jgi:hypothetical protein
LISFDNNGEIISQLDPNLTVQYFPPNKITPPITSFKINCPVIQAKNDLFVFACFSKDGSYDYGYLFDGKPVTILSINKSGKIIGNVMISTAGTWNHIIDIIPTHDGGYAILVTRSSWERKVDPYPKRCNDPAPPPPK